jgi:hypothetical protein
MRPEPRPRPTKRASARIRMDERNPADSPLLEVLTELEGAGYLSQFQVAEDGVRCLTCRSVFSTAAIDADRMVRLEGASDPADMLAVLPVQCPVCAAMGTLVCNYGPESTVEDAELLVSLERTPARAAHEETARVDPSAN